MNKYPKTAEEVLDDQIVFPVEILQAVKAFAQSKPWRGNQSERQFKFRTLNGELAQACGIVTPDLRFIETADGDSSASSYSWTDHRITLVGRHSVVTLLHEWGHVLYGMSEREACRWSLNLFRRCFPKSWSRLRFEGHLARREPVDGV